MRAANRTICIHKTPCLVHISARHSWSQKSHAQTFNTPDSAESIWICTLKLFKDCVYKQIVIQLSFFQCIQVPRCENWMEIEAVKKKSKLRVFWVLKTDEYFYPEYGQTIFQYAMNEAVLFIILLHDSTHLQRHPNACHARGILGSLECGACFQRVYTVVLSVLCSFLKINSCVSVGNKMTCTFMLCGQM